MPARVRRATAAASPRDRQAEVVDQGPDGGLVADREGRVEGEDGPQVAAGGGAVAEVGVDGRAVEVQRGVLGIEAQRRVRPRQRGPWLSGLAQRPAEDVGTVDRRT